MFDMDRIDGSIFVVIPLVLKTYRSYSGFYIKWSFRLFLSDFSFALTKLADNTTPYTS